MFCAEEENPHGTVYDPLSVIKAKLHCRLQLSVKPFDPQTKVRLFSVTVTPTSVPRMVVLDKQQQKRRLGPRSVSFDQHVKTHEIPGLEAEQKEKLFYSTDEISSMKDAALIENAGVMGSIDSQGEDLFDTSAVNAPIFRRKSLERVSQKDLSPIRSASSKASKSTESNVTTIPRSPRERPRRAERGNLVRSRSSRGPTRTDSVSGRGPPRRAASSMAGLGKNSTLQMMQASTQVGANKL